MFLFGHSLGGAISINFAGRSGIKLDGVILNAPAYIPGTGVSKIKIALGRVLNNFLPHLKVPASLDGSTISRDPVEIEAYKNDPLNCAFNTVRQGNSLLDELPLVPSAMKKVNFPLLLTHGKADQLVKWEGTEELFKVCPSKDKTLEYFEDSFHEIHNDFDKEKYLNLVSNWLSAH
mgnify:CR=1 FL=1